MNSMNPENYEYILKFFVRMCRWFVLFIGSVSYFTYLSLKVYVVFKNTSIFLNSAILYC